MSARMVRPNEAPLDNKVRARRIDTPKPCVVETKTIGGSMVFCLPMLNVSRTGMLLFTGKYQRVPFQLNTILEIVVDPRGQLFERPISCMAKVVRLEKADQKKVQYGIHIILMESRDVQSWEKTVEKLEVQSLTQ